MRFVTVLDPGPLTTVQDEGRPGWAHLGVPRAGALDAGAARAANLLVGNPVSAALLETTLGGVTVRVESATTVAVTGARAAVTARGRAAAWGEALSLPGGAVLTVGPARTGVRSYVAFAGGIAVEPMFGSRSTDTLAWIGPPPLAVGTVLPVAEPVAGPLEVPVIPDPPADVVLRYRPGPRDDWVEAGPDRDYTVAPASSRIGLRLAGPALVRTREGELPSEGVVLGSIQVPADGQPIVFLHDHPTTGGYPVVGVVVAEDLRSCAQLKPGASVHFQRLPA